MNPKKAIVLLSGGLDSTTTLAIATAQRFDCYALSFNYGQRNQFELAAARRVARHFRVKDHLVIDIDLRKIGGSALTSEIDVPKDRDLTREAQDIPITYVPARNTIFLSFALSWAEVLNAVDIFIGVNALDFSGYPDCRPAFIEAFERVANSGTRAGHEGQRFTIHAPLLHLTKAEIIRKGTELGVDYGLTMSCYDPLPAGIACGRCDSCRLRKKGFLEAGVPDPTMYQA